MESTHCLNCGQELTGKFCSGCGQKADTHRISFKKFISHDIMHGAFHMEKGMLFTAKQALIRPGQAALDYISGKRVRFYNIFYFILLLIGLILLLMHYYHELALQYQPERVLSPNMNDAGRKINQFLTKYNKVLIFSFAPILAFNSYLIFRRSKFNYSEHFIISGMLLLGMLIIVATGILISYLEFTGFLTGIADWVSVVLPFIILLYIISGYYDAFKTKYQIAGFSLRILLFFILCFIEFSLFLILVLGIAGGWNGDTEIEFTF